LALFENENVNGLVKTI